MVVFNLKKHFIPFIFLTFTAILLAGCMYPGDLKTENQVPAQDQIDSVQRAITQFQEDTGVLPIKNREQDTDLFIKYLIDFEKLVPKYLASAPANSYEKGGIFQYIIWNPENKPTVKLVDLRVPERIRDVNLRQMTMEYPQYKDRVSESVYTINFKNLGFENEITVASPYSNTQLPLVLSTLGDVYVDYSIDLNLFLQEHNLTPEPGEDIRFLLAEYYPVVPAYSLPYTVDDENEPIFMYNPLE